MKAISDSRASEAQASLHMVDQVSGGTEVSGQENVNLQSSPVQLDSLEFLIELPVISALDLDVIKLTAQFAAKNGKQFILQLSQKESRNPQFDFLKPHNHLHSLYQALVNQYKLVLNPSSILLDRIKRCAFSKNEHLKLVKHRAQIEKFERQKAIENEAAANAEAEAFSKIDWHDFCIAETINFGPEDQQIDLPQPCSLQTLQAMPVSQRLEMWSGRQNEAFNPNPSNNQSLDIEDDEEEMEIEDNEEEYMKPQLMPVSMNSVKAANEIIMGSALGSAGPIKIKSDYIPKAASLASTELTQICSICKASVPISKIDEHIRIELLDPKWRTQRLAMMAKNTESNLVETGTDVSKNLESLARHRSDIFTPSSSTTTVERGPTRPIWDGRADSVGEINRAALLYSKPQIAKEMEALQRSGDFSIGHGPRVPQQQQPQPPFYPPQSQQPPIYHPQSQQLPFYPPQFPPGFPLPPNGFPPAMTMPPQGPPSKKNTNEEKNETEK